jgi:hypothetical protein
LGKNEIYDKELSHSWTDYLDDCPNFLYRTKFSSRNLLDSAAGGTFMSLTLGAITKLLDNMMVNYSEWHTATQLVGITFWSIVFFLLDD